MRETGWRLGDAGLPSPGRQAGPSAKCPGIGLGGAGREFCESDGRTSRIAHSHCGRFPPFARESLILGSSGSNHAPNRLHRDPRRQEAVPSLAGRSARGLRLPGTRRLGREVKPAQCLASGGAGRFSRPNPALLEASNSARAKVSFHCGNEIGCGFMLEAARRRFPVRLFPAAPQPPKALLGISALEPEPVPEFSAAMITKPLRLSSAAE